MASNFPIEGGCTCGNVRYRLLTEPLAVHCCHCTWCQRETGSAFAVNAMIESDRVVNLRFEPEIIHTPSESGAGQHIARCPECRVALWSHYSGSGHVTKFVRIGTLDNPADLPPEIHIFTSSKQPWVVLPNNVPAFSEFYERNQIWSTHSLERLEAIKPKIDAYRASLSQPQT